MDKALYYMAYLANVILIGFALYMFAFSYHSDRVLALLLVIPAGLSICAMRSGPDLEERRLIRALSKARMRKELADLEKK